MTDLPPWPANVNTAAAPGTEAWARHQLATLFNHQDVKAITDLVGIGLVPHPSLWRARTHYARVCHERQWPGHTARLAWAILEALLKQPVEDDIPF